MTEFAEFRVRAADRGPLLAFMLHALRDAGCRVIHHGPPNRAPFRVSFERPDGVRMGIIAYAFFANSRKTKNRPDDEHRFQVKYGSKDGKRHELWQDPFGLYTTIFCGIDVKRGVFVGADPVFHSPTKFFISVEYKQAEVDALLESRWHCWERPTASEDDPVEVLVGGTRESFLRYIEFERDAVGEDAGPRMLLADGVRPLVRGAPLLTVDPPPPGRLHSLAREFELGEAEVLDLIANARRLKMAVRGWVAEEHLVRTLKKINGVSNCERIDDEGGADVRLEYEGTRLSLECKNVLRKTTSGNLPRVDFQRTRASIADPCSRFYRATDFDVVAACLHAVTERWEFRFIPSAESAHTPAAEDD